MKSLQPTAELAIPPRRPVRIDSAELVTVQRLAGAVVGPTVVRPRWPGLDLGNWLCGNAGWLRELALVHGAVLLRGFNVAAAGGLAPLVAAMAERPIAYRERSTPRHDLGNGIYTSTEYPADQPIMFHNENAYAAVWPLRLAFHCVQPAEAGGETPLADCRRVLTMLDPTLVARFERKRVLYVRNFIEGLGLSWQTAFGHSERDAVEAVCRQAGYGVEWRSAGLRTRRVASAVARHPQTGEAVWFNHVALFHATSLDPRTGAALLACMAEEDLPFSVYYGDGSPIEAAVADEIRAAYHACSYVEPWQPDDVLLVDNMLMAHGRRPFTGPRQVLVSLLEAYPAAWCDRA
jgi:alpha-ketoglutarate-dependent taurine dioxygenase